MKTPPPNLFRALFEIHPRDGRFPRENFLTESFVYLLRTDERVRNAWLSELLGRTVNTATCDISTRLAEKDVETDTSLFPDLLMEGSLSDGERFAVYSEHKWHSRCNPAQLARYQNIATSKGKHARLTFLCANQRQKSDAENCFPDKSCKCLLWEDAFNALDTLADKSVILEEFLDFMKTNGLGPGQPLTVAQMTAFLLASDFLKSLLSLTNKLYTNFSWDAIPDRYRTKQSYVHDSWGRVAIVFPTEESKPTLTVGFLYDEVDHKVTFVDRNRGIDLLLRIESSPKNLTSIRPALDALEEKRKHLNAASVLLKGDAKNGNNHTILIVRDCLADVIGDARTESAQLAAIHARLIYWLHVLFDDGSLEAGFKNSHLDSGMK